MKTIEVMVVLFGRYQVAIYTAREEEHYMLRLLLNVFLKETHCGKVSDLIQIIELCNGCHDCRNDCSFDILVLLFQCITLLPFLWPIFLKLLSLNTLELCLSSSRGNFY